MLLLLMLIDIELLLKESTAAGSGYFLVGAQFCLGATAIDFIWDVLKRRPCLPSAVDQEGGSWLLDMPSPYPKSYPKVCLMTSPAVYYGGVGIWWEHKGSTVGTGL
jgi:hypothetical protein